MYCTRLKQAQTDEEREKIKADMRADVIGGGAAILQVLEKTFTAKDWEEDRTNYLQQQVRKEARALGAGAKATGKSADDDDAAATAFQTTLPTPGKRSGWMLRFVVVVGGGCSSKHVCVYPGRQF